MAEDAFGTIALRMYTPKQIDAIKDVPVSFEIRNFLPGTVMALATWEMEWGDGGYVTSQYEEYLVAGQSRTLKYRYPHAGSYTIRFEWLGGFRANDGRWYRPDGQPGNCHEAVVIPVYVREPALSIANAGSLRPFFVDLLGGGLIEDLVLDGSGSYHPDGLPITYQWAVMGGPCAGNLPWQLAQFNSPKAVALRAGTTISKPCLGTYGFRLEVRDSNGGIGSAFVYHTLAELNHAPEANAGAPRVWQLGTGYRLLEDFVLDGTHSRDPDGDPLSYGWTVQSGPGMTKLPWQTNTFTQASAIALRAQTVVPPDCLGQYVFRLMVTDAKGGVNSSVVQHRFEIVAPTLRIGGRKVAEYLELSQEGLKLSVQTTAPAGAVMPDAYALDVTNEFGTLLGSLPVPVAGIVLWKGETNPGGHGRLGLGLFTLRITAGTEGLVLARSTEHQIRVVDFFLDFIGGTSVREVERPTGRDQGSDRGPFTAPDLDRDGRLQQRREKLRPFTAPDLDPDTNGSRIPDPRRPRSDAGRGNLSVEAGRGVAVRSSTRTSIFVSDLFAIKGYVISDFGPDMPQIAVKVRGQGFPVGHQPQWEMRLEVIYQTAARTDVVKLPSDGWQKLVSDKWEIVPSQFCGGRVTAFCRTTLDGEELIGRSFDDFLIWGQNPGKELVRTEFGLLSFQVVGYLASRFTQFSSEIEPLRIDAHRGEPAPVLVRGSRHGIGGLAEPVLPKHLWNWRENIKETTNRLAQHRANAQAYQTQVQQGQPWDERTGGEPPGQGVAYPDAPPFSDDQLDLEMWSRYASGLRYHDYLPDNKIWVRRANLDADGGASLGYAESCEFVRDSVRDELYPSGWYEKHTVGRSSVPVAAIKELRKDARASEALDYLLAAGWTAHLVDLTVLHPFRANLDERELLIDNLPVSDEQRATWLAGAIRRAFRSSKELRLKSELAAAFQIFIRTDLL